MARIIPVALLLALIFSSPALAQKLKKADKELIASLEKSIHYLADDKLEGRRAGTAGEKLASDYISSEFQSAGLYMLEGNSWLQPFEIDDGKQIDSSTHFIVNNKELAVSKDYFPLAFSATKHVSGTLAIALQESGVPWFVDLKDMLEENHDNPHFDLGEALHVKVKECAKNGASAVIFYNDSKFDDDISFNKRDNTDVEKIPVLYITADAKKKYFKDESASLDVKIGVSISEKKRTGHNVIGFINNGADKTIILGAHYDHLGYGEDGNSMYRGTDRQIHNGADDNASGTAALIELAKILKKSKFKNNNYLFIAFSGEELGLFGSKYFVEHSPIDLKAVNYMINMDMVGRLNDSSHVLTIGGYGTSPEWGELFNLNNSEKKYFKLSYDSSGTGPSDHTSFYRKDIPVLFFFTGLHKDYHRPSDDFDKINYTGELHVVKYIYQLIENLNNKGKLAFSKTRETQTTSSARFSVSLGIMPDYTFTGTGVRVDGVSDGRPAQKAGLKSGDIIIQLGEYNVSSLENYMQALSRFKKGDSTSVKYKHGNDVVAVAVRF
ncbi:MAG TPA: M20/M25/M40 family metallo-hydrolase [Puia sp.]|nr:M20/M25/M40 family metallo-hydrolase [Puia sp.]